MAAAPRWRRPTNHKRPVQFAGAGESPARGRNGLSRLSFWRRPIPAALGVNPLGAFVSLTTLAAWYNGGGIAKSREYVPRVKIVVNIATLIALIWLVYVSRDRISEVLNELPDLAWWFLILQIPIQLIGYAAVAHLYYSYFQSAGFLGRLKIREMYKIALELNFVNSVFPSGGVSGFSYLSLRVRPFGISFAASTLAQSLRFGLTYVSFIPILGLGLLLLAFDDGVQGWALLLGGGVFLMLLVGTALFVYLISSRSRIKEFVTWLPKAINKLTQLLPYRSGKELISMVKVERVLGEVHAGYMKIYRNLPALKKPFVYALINNAFELLTIYLVFLAFGATLNPGAVILAYAVANFAGLIAVLPGGIGVYEPLMVSILIACGVGANQALTGTLVYRVLNLMLFVPVGAVLYYHAVNRRQVRLPDTRENADILAPLMADDAGDPKREGSNRSEELSK